MANTLIDSGCASADLVFESTTFEVITRNDQPWLKAADLARALGYSRSDKIARLYDRNSTEFTSSMTDIVETPTSGSSGNLMTQTRIFSLRGAHLLAMFARTSIAALFRKWVLDILDAQTDNSMPASAPYAVAPHQTLSADQADTLRNMLMDAAAAMPKDLQGVVTREGLIKLENHFKVGYREIPQAQFLDAVSLVSRHIVHWNQAKALPAPAEDKPTFSLLRKRWLVYFDCNGVECAKPVPTDAFVISPDELPVLIRQFEDAPFATGNVAAIAHACNDRMTSEVTKWKEHAIATGKMLGRQRTEVAIAE